MRSLYFVDQDDGLVKSYQADGTITPVESPTVISYESFPIGSVFIAVVADDPATLLGYGTWVAFGAGRVLVGLDSGDIDFDTSEETGGAKTVAAAGTNSGGTVDAHTTQTVLALTPGVGATYVDGPGSHAVGQPTFAGDPTSVVQPYIVVYMHKRVS